MTQSPIQHAPASAKPRIHKLVIITLVVVTLLSLGTAVGVLVVSGMVANPLTSGGLTEKGAESACTAAFEKEWQRRNNQAASGSNSGLLATSQGIDIATTTQVGDGYKVTGVVKYSISGSLAPVASTINLSCLVTGTDVDPKTEVGNL